MWTTTVSLNASRKPYMREDGWIVADDPDPNKPGWYAVGYDWDGTSMFPDAMWWNGEGWSEIERGRPIPDRPGDRFHHYQEPFPTEDEAYMAAAKWCDDYHASKRNYLKEIGEAP